MTSSNIYISELNIYPVKSLAAIRLHQSRVVATGLQYDRQWMIVDQNGRFITQRQLPQMALIQPSLNDGILTLTASGEKNCQIANPNDLNQTMTVQVWDTTIEAVQVDPLADAWLTNILKLPCHLVRFADNTTRSLDLNYAHPDDQTAFADGFPILLISEASLNNLNQRLAHPVPMTRFRPNIVVTGCEAFTEDSWKQIQIADIRMRVVKPCSRCVMTTVDPNTGRKIGPEPLKTLFKFRKQGKQAMFGQNLIHDDCGELKLKDPVTILTQ